MGNLAKGSPLIKKLIFFVSYLTRAESHRGQGIGKMLMSAVVSDERFVKAGALLKTKDAHGLYRKYGFQDVDAGRVMYRTKEG